MRKFVKKRALKGRDERYDEKNPADDSAMELEAKPR